MTEILESIMLICFGFSWPLTVYKNIKAKTAKSMSLPFILLIIAGYIAGITAKVYNQKFNYVLLVYVINLIIVCINLVVYFINKSIDNREDLIMKNYEFETEKFKKLNSMVKENGIVFMGDDYFYDMPLNELADDYNISTPIYNRSIKGMTIADTDLVINDCILELNPNKVFLNIGASDLKDENFNADTFISKYEWFLYTLNNKCKAKIHIISIPSDSKDANMINERLKNLAKDTGCVYIDMANIMHYKKPEFRFFDLLKSHLRNHPITFGEALTSVSYR